MKIGFRYRITGCKPLLAVALLVLPAAALAQDLFNPVNHHDVGMEPYDVAAADFNRDGRPDLVVANKTSSDVSLLLGTRDLSFEFASLADVGTFPAALATARMNGDAYPDVITSNSGSDDVSVLIYAGTGSFAPAVDYLVGETPWGIVAEDLNGDGIADVAVVNREDRTFSVLLNDGEGGLSLSGTYGAGGAYIHPSWIDAGDFSGDGLADIAVVKNYQNLYFTQGYVQIFTNDGNGGFPSSQTIDLGPFSTTPLAVDLDGDGDVDLAVSGLVDSAYKLSVLLNDGQGHFAAPVAYYAGASGRADVGDFNFDQDLDVAVSDKGVYSYSFTVLLNNGDATFAEAFSVAVGNDPMGLCTGDFDTDGDHDVAVAVSGDDNLAVAYSTANPTGVDEDDFTESSTECKLYQNAPNPFGPRTSISYYLPEPGVVEMQVYDVSGRLVRTLVDDEMRGPGRHAVAWDGLDDIGRAVASGVYLCRLETPSEVMLHRMVLLR